MGSYMKRDFFEVLYGKSSKREDESIDEMLERYKGKGLEIEDEFT